MGEWEVCTLVCVYSGINSFIYSFSKINIIMITEQEISIEKNREAAEIEPWMPLSK